MICLWKLRNVYNMTGSFLQAFSCFGGLLLLMIHRKPEVLLPA